VTFENNGVAENECYERTMKCNGEWEALEGNRHKEINFQNQKEI
jgi:hypothetical protein